MAHRRRTAEQRKRDALARRAGFEDADAAADVLERASLGLDEYNALYGAPVAAVSTERRGLWRRQDERARDLLARMELLEGAVEEAYAAGDHAAATDLEEELDEVYEQLSDVAQQLEEGGEEERVGEGTWGDYFESGLADLYYRATRDPLYAKDEEHRSGRALQHFVQLETGKRVTTKRAVEMGREAFKARRQRLERMRSRLRSSTERVPEHVRVEHELARLRAARVPPELAAALGFEPLRPNAPMHPVLDATIDAIAAGERPERAMRLPLSAGLPLVLSLRVVRECRLYVVAFYRDGGS